jgi:hypothetical protein
MSEATTKALCIVDDTLYSSATFAVHRVGCRAIGPRNQDWIVKVPAGQPVAPVAEASVNADGQSFTVKGGWIRIHSCCKRR